jgi:ribosomal protein L14
MLFVGSLVKVIDNTGVLKARCIKIVKGSSSIEAFVGDLIVVVVTEVDISKKKHTAWRLL